MNSRILALGLFVLGVVGGAVWFTWRPAAPQRGAEVPGRTDVERAAVPRLDLARPDGTEDPDSRSARAADEVPPVDPASSRDAETVVTSVAVDAGMPTSVDHVTDETRAFADKYRDVGADARRASLLVLESVIAERVESGDIDPAGKSGPSLADLKAEAEWLRTHLEG